jgi:endonuclease I
MTLSNTILPYLAWAHLINGNNFKLQKAGFYLIYCNLLTIINEICKKRMKSFYTIILALSIVLFSNAQAPANYYNSAAGLSGTSLRLALHNIIDNHTSQSYSSLYTHYNSTDILTGDTIWDMYSLKANGTANYYFKNIAARRCGNYSIEGDCFNREHSWPQSWFSSASPMVSDLFHVYPTDGKVNGIRSNYPYGKVGTATTTTTNGSKLGPCVSPGYAGTVFEPIDTYKGDFARTYFYMTTRYYTEDASWSSSGSVTKCDLKPWTITLMMKWDSLDPVSAKEISRNNAVYAIQGNRNPFIDNPAYVQAMFGNVSSIVPLETIVEDLISVYPNPVANDELNINVSALTDEPVTIYISDMSGKVVFNQLYTDITFEAIHINTEKLKNGVYYVKAVKGSATVVKRAVVLR